MLKILKIVFSTIGILFLVGGACPSNETTPSNKVAQSEIYQSYSISENGGNYDVTAFFRIGGETGTTLALSPPSKILFNGQPLKESLNTSSGTFYTASVPSSATTGTFQFTDRNGKTYTNKIELAKFTILAKNLKSNGTTPITLPLSRAVSGNTSVTLLMQAANSSNTELIGDIFNVSLNEGKNAIVVKPEAWKDFSRGNVALNLRVADSVGIQQGTNLGGKITFNYETSAVNVALTKATKPAQNVSKKAGK
jgi:hypothetical protein